MPVPSGTKYRYVNRGGKQIRLAIAPGGKVVEAKSKSEVLKKNKLKRKAQAHGMN
jgi:hypothetical protein